MPFHVSQPCIRLLDLDGRSILEHASVNIDGMLSYTKFFKGGLASELGRSLLPLLDRSERVRRGTPGMCCCRALKNNSTARLHGAMIRI